MKLGQGVFTLPTFNITNTPFSLIGEGVDVTIVKLEDVCLLKHSAESPHLSSVTIRDLTVLVDKPVTRVFDFIRTDEDRDLGRRDCQGITFDNVKIICERDGVFNIGISFNNNRNINITNCVIDNKENQMHGIGVHQTGYMGHNLRISHTHMRFLGSAVSLISHPEGFHMSDCELVSVGTGVVIDSSHARYGKPHFTIHSTHMNCIVGIRVDSGSQVNFYDNLIYYDEMGISVELCNSGIIHDNHLYDLNGTNAAINISDCTKMIVHHNSCWNGEIISRDVNHSIIKDNLTF